MHSDGYGFHEICRVAVRFVAIRAACNGLNYVARSMNNNLWREMVM